MSGRGAGGGVGPSRRAVLVGGTLVATLGVASYAAAALRISSAVRTPPTHGASPTTQPPPSRYIGDPVPGVVLHPAALSHLQSFVPLPETAEWFTTQAATGTSGLFDPAGLAVGDIVISRLAFDGRLLDSMTLPDSGHGMSLIPRIEDGNRVVYSCWFAPGASGSLYDVVRLPYSPGVAARSAATAVVAGLGYPLDPYLDVSTDSVTLRHQGGKGPQYTRHDWADFVAGDLSRPTGLIATADSPPTHQGFCSLGDRFFFYTGATSNRAGGDPPLITEFGWASGEVVGPSLDASMNSRRPGGTYPGGRMEPEGATIATDRGGAPALLVGVANGRASAATVPRSYRTFRYSLVAD